jgi:hypothetical protein
LVAGLDVFGAHFSGYQDRYVFIGGAACYLAMAQAGLDFRATRDLDIVLCVETLDSAFVAAFWDFIHKGGYRCRERSTGKKEYYRFHKPGVIGYPHMLELFFRIPDSLSLPGTSHLTPIPVGKDLSSLSAILLDDDYYHFLLGGRREARGLSFVGPEHLLPLKAKAWLDLSKRKLQGEDIDNKALRKHKNDVFRLYSILNPAFGGKIPDTIKCDLREFLARMEMEIVDFKSLGLNSTTRESVLADIWRIFSLNHCG